MVFSYLRKNKDLAQEELKALSDINDENKDKSGFDANKLNVALADIKAAVAKAKESKGELTEDDVRKIVEDTLKNYNWIKLLQATKSMSSSTLPSIFQEWYS